MVDKTPPKVGLPYGVAQGYFIGKKKEKKEKKKVGAKERMRILIPSPSRMTIVDRRAQSLSTSFLFCFFFVVKNIAWGDWESCLCKFWFLKKNVLQVSMLKYVWTLSLRNFSTAISPLLEILRISKLKLMETETDKQTLTKLHLLNMNDSLSLRLTSRKQYRGKKTYSQSRKHQ